MKYLFTVVLLISNLLYGQCRDVYEIKVECPTEADSLVLYNNALKIYDFYDNNKSYKKTRTRELNSSSDKRNIFEDLATARRLFFVIRREVAKLKESEKKFAAGKTSVKYVDIAYKDYYQEIDEYRFYQRELESQIVNKAAPTAMYDVRIAPIIVNEYHCIDSMSPYFGDLVNIPLYIPVTVKPVMLLTESEIGVRNSILQRIDPTYKPISIKTAKKIVIKKDKVAISTPEVQFGCVSAIPVYAYHLTRGGAFIGFFCNRYFIKIKPDQYVDYAVPKWAQDILQDEKQLRDVLNYKFGKDYLLGIIK